MFLLKLVFLDKESKLYLLLYVDVCSRTAHLFYFRELKNIETNHEKNLYCVMNRKVTGHYFFAEKEKKSIIQTNPSYNDLKESCYYLVLFFKSFFLWCLWWKVHESKKLPFWGNFFLSRKKNGRNQPVHFIPYPTPMC